MTTTERKLIIHRDGCIYGFNGELLGCLGTRQAAERYCKRAGWAFEFKKTTVRTLNH